VSDLPRRSAVFPLRGGILLPRATLPLNIFEPRYIEMVDAALAGTRTIVMVQPKSDEDGDESPSGPAPLRTVGCLGRITSFSETDDGRYLITLTGIARCEILAEEVTDRRFRICRISSEAYGADLVQDDGSDVVDRDRLIEALKTYLEAKSLKADWQAIHRATTEFLVNTLSMISPYDPEEKQALLEAPDLKSRAEALIALSEMYLATRDDGSSTLQ
jgi:uncharacterized protein